MPKATWELIGPAEAQALLDMNIKNYRPHDKKRVSIYSREMSRGRWDQNGETIKIAKSGILLDGQHRLMAIVRCGLTFKMLVVREIESDGKTMDRGKPRTIAQWCRQEGYKHATTLPSVARNVLFHTKGSWGKAHFQTNEVVDSELYDFIKLHHGRMIECITAANVAKKIVPPSFLATVLFVGCDGKDPHDIEEAMWFVKALQDGEGLTSQDAALHFRNRMLTETPQTKISLFLKRALLTMAWNKTVLGDSCSASGLRLRLSGANKQDAPSVIETIS